jgi:hypothetical protein
MPSVLSGAFYADGGSAEAVDLEVDRSANGSSLGA